MSLVQIDFKLHLQQIHCFVLGVTDGHRHSPICRYPISIISYMSIISNYIGKVCLNRNTIPSQMSTNLKTRELISNYDSVVSL